jgi:hypothetical protein
MQCNKSKKKIEIKKILTYIEYRTEGKDAYMELSHKKKKNPMEEPILEFGVKN